MIQPPETTEALTAGLKDACGDVRIVASAGWRNETGISEEAIPALIEALSDPEVRVRANAAHALARLEALPGAAIPLLIECTADADDALRMNAAIALKRAPADAVAEVRTASSPTGTRACDWSPPAPSSQPSQTTSTWMRC
jgi:HEAT repeats